MNNNNTPTRNGQHQTLELSPTYLIAYINVRVKIEKSLGESLFEGTVLGSDTQYQHIHETIIVDRSKPISHVYQGDKRSEIENAFLRDGDSEVRFYIETHASDSNYTTR